MLATESFLLPSLLPPLPSSAFAFFLLQKPVLLLESPSSWVTLSGGAWAPGVLMRQPQPRPHPPEAGLVGPQDPPLPAYLSHLLPSRLGPVSAFALDATQYKGGGH